MQKRINLAGLFAIHFALMALAQGVKTWHSDALQRSAHTVHFLIEKRTVAHRSTVQKRVQYRQVFPLSLTI